MAPIGKFKKKFKLS